MFNEIYKSVNDVGYNSLTENDLKNAIESGSKSIEFTKLISWISKELQILYSLEEHVNAISSPDDSSAFLMELSSFLKETGCQYSILTDGHMNERINSESKKFLLLDYLLTELKSAKMIKVHKPDDGLQVTLNESNTASDMKNMLQVLKFPKPPSNIPPKVLFNKVETKLKEVLSSVPAILYREPLFSWKLMDRQWHTLDLFYQELLTEYKTRKELLIKRLDVTIQSFEWSDRLRSKSAEIQKAFGVIREQLTVTPHVRLSDILAARRDLGIIEKTSSASVRRKTKSHVNEVVIGTVPDRGGRPYEQEPPPPEMPSWQQRSNSSNFGGGRGRGSNPGSNTSGRNAPSSDQNRARDNSYRGGRVQAGWNNPNQSQYHQRSDFSNNRDYSHGTGPQNYNSGYQYQGSANFDDGCVNTEYNSRGRGQRYKHGSNSREYQQNYQSKQSGSYNSYNKW